MIEVTKLNGTTFILNSDLIETVEGTPDTVIRLTTKNYHIVAEYMPEVVQKVIDYKRECNNLSGRLGLL